MKLSSYKALENALVGIGYSDLLRLVYISTISKNSKHDPNLFTYIQSHAESYNKQHGIKGFLCNSNRYFLQCLEGQKQDLLPLLEKVYRDPRHSNVQVVFMEAIKGYSFVDWRMRSVFMDANLMQNVERKVDQQPLEWTEFLPFKPQGWPAWMFAHFINTMRKFDSPMHAGYSHLIRYDTLPKNNLSVAVFMALALVVLVSCVMVVKFFYG